MPFCMFSLVVGYCHSRVRYNLVCAAGSTRENSFMGSVRHYLKNSLFHTVVCIAVGIFIIRLALWSHTENSEDIHEPWTLLMPDII